MQLYNNPLCSGGYLDIMQVRGFQKQLRTRGSFLNMYNTSLFFIDILFIEK